jgi:hypothetical protein
VRLPKFRYVLFSGVLLGAVIPLALTSCLVLRVFQIPSQWFLFIWPTSIMLMSPENLEFMPYALGTLIASIAYNIIFYIIAFSVIWCLVWVFRAWRTSLRDGTTI